MASPLRPRVGSRIVLGTMLMSLAGCALVAGLEDHELELDVTDSSAADVRESAVADAADAHPVSADASDAAPCVGSACETGKPCTTNGECAGNACTRTGSPVTQDGGTGNACTTTCTNPADCLPGWTCSPVTGQTGSLCQCAYAAETCDGKDNDCNGVVDEHAPSDAFCVTSVGPNRVCADGKCECAAGTITCTSASCVDTATDSKNCGACGIECGEGATCTGWSCRCTGGVVCDSSNNVSGQCVDGSCRPVTRLAQVPILDIAADGTQVHFASADGIYRVAPGDIAPTRIAPVANVFAVAADSQAVYWVSSLDAKIMTCPKSGCGAGPTQFADFSSSPIRSNGTNLYWVSGGDIATCPVSGCSDAGPTKPHLPTPFSGLQTITLDAANLYYSTFGFSTDVASIPLAGDGGIVLSDMGPASTTGLASDGTDVYWADPAQGKILKCATTGCASPVLVVTEPMLGTWVATSDGFLYWGVNRALRRCSIAGPCSPSTFATLPQNDTVQVAAFDATHVYFAGSSSLHYALK